MRRDRLIRDLHEIHYLAETELVQNILIHLRMSLSQLLVCLNIFSDVGLLQVFRHHKYISVKLMQPGQKADLNASRTMQTLQALKG